MKPTGTEFPALFCKQKEPETPSLLAFFIGICLLALARKGVKIIILKKGESGYGNKENKKWK